MQALQKLLFSLPLWALAAQAQTLAITHANVIDTVSGAIQSDTTVVIDGNRITRVTHSTRRNPKAAQVIDAHGAYLIPGLWDMHTHVYFDSTAADGTDIDSRERPNAFLGALDRKHLGEF